MAQVELINESNYPPVKAREMSEDAARLLLTMRELAKSELEDYENAQRAFKIIVRDLAERYTSGAIARVLGCSPQWVLTIIKEGVE